MTGKTNKSPQRGKKVKEFGENYLLHATKKEELFNRLQALAQHLELQEETVENGFALPRCCFELPEDALIKHKDKAIRVLVASCLADVLRLSVPTPPYSPSQLEDVFKLFLRCLKFLDNANSPVYERCYHLLETLSGTRSFTMLTHPEFCESEDLLVSVFATLFTNVNSDMPSKVVTHMLQILISVVHEMDGPPPQTILDVILDRIIEPNRSNEPVACQMARSLIEQSTTHLQPAIASFLNAALVDGGAESEVADHVHDIILELSSMDAPEILVYVLPTIANELRVEDLDTREKAVDVLSEIFSRPGTNMPTQYHSLFNEYLQRFLDIDDQIRQKMVLNAEGLIAAHPSFSNEICEPWLRNRVVDSSHEVRKDVISVTCRLVLDYGTKIVSESMLRDLKDRLRDKKPAVRSCALDMFSKVYEKYITSSLTNDDTDWDVLSNLPFSEWLPSCIINTYRLPEHDVKREVSRSVDTFLVPRHLSYSDKAKCVIGLYAKLDDAAEVAFEFMVKGKVRFVTSLKTLLQLRGDLKQDPDNNALKRKVDATASALATSMGDSKASEFFKLICTHKDNKVASSFEKLISPDTTFEELKDIADDLAKRCSSFAAFIRENALQMTLPFNAKFAVALVDHIRSALSDGFSDIAVSGLCLLKIFSSESAAHLVDCSKGAISVLTDAIAAENDDITERILEVLLCIPAVAFPKATSASRKSLSSALTKLCASAYPRQAKLAAKLLGSLTEEDGFSGLGSITNHLVAKLKKAGGEDLVSALSALSQFVKYSFMELDGHVNTMVEFSLSLLRTDLKAEKKKSKLPSKGCEARVAAFRLLTNYVNSSENEDTTDTLAELLLTCISNIGDITGTGVISAIDSRNLRLVAGHCLLKLARRKDFDAKISVGGFQTMSKLVKDEDLFVREEFLKKLSSGLLAKNLPIKYLSMLCLYAMDSSKENAHEAQKTLALLTQKQNAIVKRVNSNISSVDMLLLLPEGMLSYLLHLIAHQPDFKLDSRASAMRCIGMFFDVVLKPDANYAFLMKMLDTIQNAMQDATDSDNTGVNSLAEMSKHLMKQKAHGRKVDLDSHPGDIPLPSKLYTKRDHYEPATYLPSSFSLSHKNSSIDSANTTVSPKRSPKRKLQDENTPSPKSAKTTPKNCSKHASPKDGTARQRTAKSVGGKHMQDENENVEANSPKKLKTGKVALGEVKEQTHARRRRRPIA